jgi:hypothetical protein
MRRTEKASITIQHEEQRKPLSISSMKNRGSEASVTVQHEEQRKPLSLSSMENRDSLYQYPV